MSNTHSRTLTRRRLMHCGAGLLAGAAVAAGSRPAAAVLKLDVTQGSVRPVPIAIPDFIGGAQEATAGRGVDIVLNSLTGRFIAQSLKCLAPFGRFIELGKSDIYRNSKLNLERLGENISYLCR